MVARNEMVEKRCDSMRTELCRKGFGACSANSMQLVYTLVLSPDPSVQMDHRSAEKCTVDND